jgi:multiphosphoryl transfer protein
MEDNIMVGIVVVSHSARLAEGVRELALQMTQGRVPLAIAGGIDDPENPIGTDAMQVLEAINQVYSNEGVVVFMDLGSALLSAETALEFLSDEQRPHVFLSSAPLIEGVLAAAVQSSVGSTPAQIIAEAEGALAVKIDQLGDTAAIALTDSVPPLSTAGEQITLPVLNRLGLHARPAARFVSTAGRFAAEITVYKGDRHANAKSINQIATLGVRQGDDIVVTADGPEAKEALAALQSLADDNFGDRDESEAGDKPVGDIPVIAEATGALGATRQAGNLAGIPVSPGIAIGPAILYRPRLPKITIYSIDNPAPEWQRLEGAIATARDEIDALYRQAVQQVGPAEAAIFEAHSLFLDDPSLVDSTRNIIQRDAVNAEAAWHEATEAVASAYREMDDDYMRARAADIEDVARRVLRHLMGMEPPSLDFAEPSILIAADLTPSDTARLDPERVLAICTELGGATAHSAILARALAIPAVVGLGHDLWQVTEDQCVAVDGERGVLWIEPDPEQLAALEVQRQSWQETRLQAKTAGQGEAITRDGRRVEIAANVGSPKDVPSALEFGAEGVGLFRTEFLFMDRQTAPTEEEQLDAYRQAALLLGDRPLIIRTLDVGGDKPLPYLDLGEEENPFLGWRAIRFCLERPDIFKPQLRAILRSSVVDGAKLNVKIMFPMIGTVGEVQEAKAILDEVRTELRAEGRAFNEDMEVGIMLEVPSAVMVADLLAREVDFFSIGTNDLTQYVMAADRGNARVAGLANALQPAVLRMVKQAADAAHAAGIWIGMCGELAGNPLATVVLVGLGLDELSMSAPSIPSVKAAVRGVTMTEAEQIALDVLALESAEAVANALNHNNR